MESRGQHLNSVNQINNLFNYKKTLNTSLDNLSLLRISP